MKAYTEFYCRQIARKFSLKFPQCITSLERLIQTSVVILVDRRVSNASVQPADSTPARLNLQMEAQQKKIELETGQLTGIIFLISGRIMIFFHILGE